MGELPEPYDEAIIYEDEKLYVCLANFPKVKGHTVIVWKEEVEDLHLLSEEDYLYLMERVDETRNAILETFEIEKVYLVYMDEVDHVHWHLIPRYNEKGYDILEHEPEELEDFSPSEEIRKNLKLEI